MATTWIEVTDSAVKIGLGAAIAGGVSVAVVFAGFIKETFTDRRARRLKNIEEAMTAAERYMNHMIRHASNCAWHYATDLSVAETKRAKNEFDKSYAMWDDSLDQLNTATSRLMLFGYHRAAEALRSISELVDGLLRAIEADGTTAEQEVRFRHFKTEVGKRRKEVILLLGAAYHGEREVERIIGPIV